MTLPSQGRNARREEREPGLEALPAILGRLRGRTSAGPNHRQGLTGLHSHERVEFNLDKIYSHDRHVTGLASVFIDGADGAHIFDQLAPLFDRGLLTPPATKTWPLKNSVEAYQRVQDGARGIKQVLLPIGGGA